MQNGQFKGAINFDLTLRAAAEPQMKFAQIEMRLSVSVPPAKNRGGGACDSVVTVADTIAVRVRRSAV